MTYCEKCVQDHPTETCTSAEQYVADIGDEWNMVGPFDTAKEAAVYLQQKWLVGADREWWHLVAFPSQRHVFVLTSPDQFMGFEIGDEVGQVSVDTAVDIVADRIAEQEVSS